MRNKILLILLFIVNISIRAEVVGVGGVQYNIIKKGQIASVHKSGVNWRTGGNVTIPSTIFWNDTIYSVVEIDDYAFADGAMNEIKYGKIALPPTIKKIGVNAFNYCTIDTLELTDLKSWCAINFVKWGGESPRSNPLVNTKHLIVGGEEVVDLIIPEGTSSISKYAFWCFQSIKTVTIPESVITIDEEAFAFCRNVKNVNIKGGTNLISGVFEDCLGLESVSIGNESTLGLGAFAGCSNLTEVNFAGNIKDIDEAAFINCIRLTSITIPTTIQKIKPRTFWNCSSLREIDIPDNITQINSSAFNGCTKLDTVYIGMGLNRIDEYAFSGCTELKDLFLYSDNAPQTSENAFLYSYQEYISLHIPASLMDTYKKTSPWYSFKEFLPLPQIIYMVDGEVYKTVTIKQGSIIIPEAEPTKEGYTFSGWSEIPETMPAKDVTVTGTFTQIDYEVGNVTYEVSGDEVSVLKGNNFSGDVEISSTIVINDKTYTVTSIADGAFQNNINITSVSIPESVTKIGANAFDGCSKLSTISIGKAIVIIGSKAFANLNSVALTRGGNGLKVNCYAESIPTTASDAFENTSISNATLLVDDNSVTAYKIAAPWSGFGTIMGFKEAAGINGILLDNNGKVKVYLIDGKSLNKTQRGYNIIKMSDGTTKKVIIK